MKLPLTGGCLCGAVRYEINAEPKRTGICHCRSCQRATGSAYFAFLHVPEEALKLTGSLTEYERQGSSGKSLQQSFCTQCGSLLFGKLEIFPNGRNVAVSSLDDPSWFKPEIEIWLEDAQPWERMDATIKKFNKNPG